MSTISDGSGNVRNRDQIGFESDAVVECPDGVAPARVELIGGRDRYSVGGRIAEGPRWWLGEVELLHDYIDLRIGSSIVIELSNGRSAPAVVEELAAPTSRRASIRGLGPPPFDVP